jgi:hypothetical protein
MAGMGTVTAQAALYNWLFGLAAIGGAALLAAVVAGTIVAAVSARRRED